MNIVLSAFFPVYLGLLYSNEISDENSVGCNLDLSRQIGKRERGKPKTIAAILQCLAPYENRHLYFLKWGKAVNRV